MTDPTKMTEAVAAAQAALAADDVVQRSSPGTAERRDRMREIIHAVAASFDVERMDLTMALTQLSARRD